MLNKDLCIKVLEESLKTGADFAEIYAENTCDDSLEMMSGEVSNKSFTNLYGVGLRILKNNEEVYGHTSDLSEESLLKLAKDLSLSFGPQQYDVKVELNEEENKNVHTVLKDPQDLAYLDLKLNMLRTSYNACKEVSDKVNQVINSITCHKQNVLICNSLGKMVKDTRCFTRFTLTVFVKDGDLKESMSESFGRNQGLEAFEQIDLKEFSQEVTNGAMTMLYAEPMVGGVMPVIIHNKFGGVILHEACGHSLEATSVSKNLSVFSGKMGTKIASDIVTAVDDGTLLNQWGSENYDDEGTPTKRNVLIENGILKSYLVDLKNDRRMNHGVTGSSRRQNYKFSPTSRMSNTFFVNGTSTVEEIIANTKEGFFAKRMGGGSVNPVTGEFNFIVNEGYMIKDGKIDKPVKGAALIGNGKDTLLNIDMIANNLDHGPGMCGSMSGSIPAGVGQPTIRLSSMLVGGKGGKK